ncbi:hypothetical protein JTE90_009763 [Oedothorax gibbosus]|uniref:Uncharacterized protein n=1 Tax=Oedothorax gibbosus TaxID=931172 RepID=A0AAV6V8C6_9ARAC|nr:hypothetical protein JTE90_009763 [Oedothorax gibbosus]
MDKTPPCFLVNAPVRYIGLLLMARIAIHYTILNSYVHYPSFIHISVSNATINKVESHQRNKVNKQDLCTEGFTMTPWNVQKSSMLPRWCSTEAHWALGTTHITNVETSSDTNLYSARKRGKRVWFGLTLCGELERFYWDFEVNEEE